MSNYKKVYKEYIKLADTLRKRGYDVEADVAEQDTKEVKSKIE